MKKLLFVATLMLTGILGSFAQEETLEDGAGTSCSNVPGANNGHCRSTTSGSGGVGYSCVDAYFFETHDCKK